MSGPGTRREGVRAAVPRATFEPIATRAPEAELVAVDEREDFGGIDFIVPLPFRSGELAQVIGGLAELRVVQTLSAGVDLLEAAVPAHVTLCSARGARDGPVAEWVIGALLGARTHLLERAGRAELGRAHGDRRSRRCDGPHPRDGVDR